MSISPLGSPPGTCWQRQHCTGPAPFEHNALWSPTRRSRGGGRRREQNQDPHPHQTWQQGALVGPLCQINKIQREAVHLLLGECLFLSLLMIYTTEGAHGWCFTVYPFFLLPLTPPKDKRLVDTQSPILWPPSILNKGFGNGQAVPEIRTLRHLSSVLRRQDH